MTHLSAATDRCESTPKEWLRCGAQVGDQVNTWARRGDIIAYVGPEAGSGSPACFKPSIAEMEINTALAFGEKTKASHIGDFTVRRTHFDYPVAAGATLHEAMHARHSLWSLEEVSEIKDKRISTLITLFEETRIESRGVEHYPRNRSFLRACALKLVIGDLKKSEILAGGVMGLSQLMLLTMARVDAGVLEKSDVELVTDEATEYLGKPLIKSLRKLWLQAQAHRKDTEWTQLEKLAQEWVKLLEDAGHDTKPEEIPKELLELLEGMMGELGDMSEETEAEARAEGGVQIVIEIGEAQAKAREDKANEDKEHKKVSSQVFDKTTGPSSVRSTSSRLVETRDPTGPERAAAVTVGKLLEKARYHDRVTVERTSAMPPGRLNGRQAVQAAAARQRGVVPTQEPWSHKRRFHTQDPELKVGTMVDISGSMGMAMEPMAVTAWVMSEAVRRVQGRHASVYYGNGVFPVLKPGEHLDKVKVYSAPDGTERFDQAFKALDGALGLLNGSGARLLVIVSDICYTPDEIDASQKWAARCHEAGVAVIVLPFGNDSYAKTLAAQPNNSVQVMSGVMNPAKAARTIGQAAADALERAGMNR